MEVSNSEAALWNLLTPNDMLHRSIYEWIPEETGGPYEQK